MIKFKPPQAILIVILLSLLMPGIYAQDISDKKIVLSEKEYSILTLLSEATKQTGIVFSYGNSLPLSDKITFSNGEIPFTEILKKIKAQTGFSYRVSSKKVILIPPPDKKHTISGYIRDAESGENLIGTSIYTVPAISGSTTNLYGYYSITLPPDSVVLTCSYAGYGMTEAKLFLDRDTVINISLAPKLLQEVVITDEEMAQDMTRMSTIELPVSYVKSLPALAGEADVMKTLQLMPGVQSGVEASSGLYVRGGSPDQNLILLDGVPVYNASHLFGFFSIFNPDAINHVELIKGGFPARYGGRLSSVVNITMKEGNQQKFKGEGSVGLIASRLTLEGPFKKGRSSYIVSARRTLADVLVRPLIEISPDGEDYKGYRFYDFNAKVNHHINAQNRLYASLYSGGDKMASDNKSVLNEDSIHYSKKEDQRLAWGNVTGALRLNSIVSPTVFSSLTATYSRYRLNTLNQVEEHEQTPFTRTAAFFKSNYISGIADVSIKEDLDFIPNTNHAIKTGFYGIWHWFSPGTLSYSLTTSKDTLVGSSNITAFEYGAYAEDDITLSRRLKINLGLHYASFLVEEKNYASIQPRLALRYLLSDKVALKASYVRMKQFIHLLTNPGIGLPTDLWVPSTSQVKPEDSWQVANGITYSHNNAYELVVEGYYKHMEGLIEYKNGASFLRSENDWQSKIEIGTGESYGTEVFVKKKKGSFTGWLGYTLSWAYRQFDNIDEGTSFPFKYDRRHDLELALIHSWNEKIHLGLTWVYGSGYPTTLGTVSYNGHSVGLNGDRASYEYADYISGRNNFRMRDYHRLDLTATFSKKKKWGERQWVLGLYNAYNRKNPFYLTMERGDIYQGKRKLVQHSLFPIIPSLSYNFKF